MAFFFLFLEQSFNAKLFWKVLCISVGGWGQKMAIFADVQHCIYADIVGEWVRKSSKTC